MGVGAGRVAGLPHRPSKGRASLEVSARSGRQPQNRVMIMRRLAAETETRAREEAQAAKTAQAELARLIRGLLDSTLSLKEEPSWSALTSDWKLGHRDCALGRLRELTEVPSPTAALAPSPSSSLRSLRKKAEDLDRRRAPEAEGVCAPFQRACQHVETRAWALMRSERRHEQVGLPLPPPIRGALWGPGQRRDRGRAGRQVTPKGSTSEAARRSAT